ncbi:MAG: hypothetical protein QM756_25710 [Polyangiaceae bacterium]
MRAELGIFALQLAAASALLLLALLASAPWFYLVMVALVAGGACELLVLTHGDDLLGRWLGVLLAVGHSATIWFFERQVRVLLPAQSLLPLNALLFSLLRPGDEASAAKRIFGVGFAPLWAGLFTYLALVRRAESEFGGHYAALAVVLAFAAHSGARSKHVPLVVAALTATAAGLGFRQISPAGLPAWHVFGLACFAAGFARMGMLGQAKLQRSLGAPPRWGLLGHTSTLLLTSPLVYGYLQARAWLPH